MEHENKLDKPDLFATAETALKYRLENVLIHYYSKILACVGEQMN